MQKILIVLLSFFLAGCTAIEKNSQEAVRDAQAGRRIAINYAKAYPLAYGALKTGMGPNINELKAHALDAMEKANDLAKQINADPNNISDEELGSFLGYKFRFCTSVVMKTIEKYAPSLVSLLF